MSIANDINTLKGVQKLLAVEYKAYNVITTQIVRAFSSGDSDSQHPPMNAFGPSSGEWISSDSFDDLSPYAGSVWITCDFDIPTEIHGFSFNGSNNIRGITLYGSDHNVFWDPIQSINDMQTPIEVYFNDAINYTYRYYRLVVNKIWSYTKFKGMISIKDFVFYSNEFTIIDPDRDGLSFYTLYPKDRVEEIIVISLDENGNPIPTSLTFSSIEKILITKKNKILSDETHNVYDTLNRIRFQPLLEKVEYEVPDNAI